MLTRNVCADEVFTCPTSRAAGLFYPSPRSPSDRVEVWDDPGAAIRGTPRTWRLDHSWLQDWLLGCPDVMGSPYVGLRRLPPGQMLTRRPGARPQVTGVIGADVWRRPDLEGSAAEEAFREAFDSAVEELALGMSVLTSELSGGLDSSYMVATLAHVTGGSVHAFVAVPESEVALPATPRIVSDEPDAQLLADAYPDRVLLQSIRAPRRSPLEIARRICERGWWPAFAVSNLGWVEEIRNRSAAMGSPYVWTGSNGNATFSHSHPYGRGGLRSRWRRSRALSGPPPMMSTLLTQAPVRATRPNRRQYLTWLAGHSHSNAAFGNPAAFAIPSVDPYRAPQVLEVAARIKPEAWRRPGMTRGFARALGQGRVPDGIRLRQARGAQGLDVWQQMYRHRLEYETQVELLADTPAIADLVDIAALRSVVGTWSWDSRLPPPQIQTSVVNRLLAFGQFIRDADDRLRRLAA